MNAIPHTPVNIDNLADIRNVTIDTSLPVDERKKSYIQQIKDPHLYRCGDTIIRVSYGSKGITMRDLLIQYLASGQGLSLLLPEQIARGQ